MDYVSAVVFAVVARGYGSGINRLTVHVTVYTYSQFSSCHCLSLSESTAGWLTTCYSWCFGGEYFLDTVVNELTYFLVHL